MDIYEIKSYTQEELGKIVHVKAFVTAMWDGKEYDLSEGMDVKYGMVVTWSKIYKNVEFDVSEVSETPIDKREIKNPLEENDRGESFSGLRRGRQRQG